MTTHEATLYTERLAGVVFDLDGVVTDTATVHARAWKRTFDEFLDRYQRHAAVTHPPFDADIDYLRYVDGKPRLAGVRDFLRSRGIVLPNSSAALRRGDETEATLAERKTRFFVEEIEREGVTAFPATVELVRALRRHGLGTAVVSSSRQCARVLAAASAGELFDVRVDGNDADRLDLPGKPDPAIFLEAARRLGTSPARCAVVEDALAGVEAGQRGGFAVVIGIDRTGEHVGEMYARGAHVVVRDLTEVSLVGSRDESLVAGLRGV